MSTCAYDINQRVIVPKTKRTGIIVGKWIDSEEVWHFCVRYENINKYDEWFSTTEVIPIPKDETSAKEATS